MNKKMKEINLATIDERASELADKYGLGIELDHFCTAYCMEEPLLSENLKQIHNLKADLRVFHGPINELFPCAIDPMVREIALKRFNQAYKLCESLGIKKMVLHSGFYPNMYFEEWYVSQSVETWKSFISDKPKDFVVCVENVMDNRPSILVNTAEAINDPRFKLCFDIGHAFVRGTSDVPVNEWIKAFAPYLGHVHIHNNDREWDWHRPLGDGGIDMETSLRLISDLAPSASWTIENPERTEESILWLKEREYL